MNWLYTLFLASQAFLILFVFLYNTSNLLLLLAAFFEVRTRLKEHHVVDPDLIMKSPHAPVISVIVPAFNEEKTVVSTIQGLMSLKYPRFEIIVVNDGSTDNTVNTVRDAFGMRRQDIAYEGTLATAPVRGFYETPIEGPSNVRRLLMIDKENGLRPDALNAGINASRGEYVCTIDADCILDENALIQVTASIMEDPEQVIGTGGQLGILNGCKVENGRVVEMGLPRNPLTMFQVVEYIRSFTGGRTAWELMRALPILSGAFTVLQKKIVMEVGGFSTRYMNSRIGREYCENGLYTVCEDMEMIVRIWRYMYDNGKIMKIAFVPYPICWTQVPDTVGDLGKQRNRWYRGLCEILHMHRSMLFNPKYGRIGLVMMPFQFLFEFLGPMVEFVGYISIFLFWMTGALNAAFAWYFFIAAFLYGSILTVVAVLLGLWREGALYQQEKTTSLFRYRGGWNKVTLFAYALLSGLGYRQMIVFYQMRGLIDFFRGSKDWLKFEHAKFEEAKPDLRKAA